MHFAPGGTLSSSLSQSERHAASAVAVIGGTEPHFPSGVAVAVSLGVAVAVVVVAGAGVVVVPEAGEVVAVVAGETSVVVVVVVVDAGGGVVPVDDGSLGAALFELPPHAATRRRPEERMRFR